MAARTLLLFLLGLLLVFLVFPVAFYVSAGLGYTLGALALSIGVYMAMHKRGKLDLVLGIVVSVLAFTAVLGTAIIHMSAVTVKEAFEELAQTKHVEGFIGEPLEARDWRIIVKDYREAKYIRLGDSIYYAGNGSKIIVVRIRFENVGEESKSLSEVEDIVLVTSSGRSYEEIRFPGLELEYVYTPTLEARVEALRVKLLDRAQTIAPGTWVEGDIVFRIPVDERPSKLILVLGYLERVEATVWLGG